MSRSWRFEGTPQRGFNIDRLLEDLAQGIIHNFEESPRTQREELRQSLRNLVTKWLELSYDRLYQGEIRVDGIVWTVTNTYISAMLEVESKSARRPKKEQYLCLVQLTPLLLSNGELSRRRSSGTPENFSKYHIKVIFLRNEVEKLCYDYQITLSENQTVESELTATGNQIMEERRLAQFFSNLAATF